MKLKASNYLKAFGIILLIAVFTTKIKFQPIEESFLTVGVGYDIEKKMGDVVEYNIPISSYTFEGDNVKNVVRNAYGTSIGSTRESRQLQSPRKFTLGYEKVYIFSEGIASYGIRPIVDSLFNNPSVNDSGLTLVFDGKAKDALKYSITSGPTSSDILEGLIKNLKNTNFFQAHYDLIDLFRKSTEEGQCLVLPYVELTPEDFKVTGMALFKDHKMVDKLNINDTKYLNLMRENNVSGSITIEKNSKKFIDSFITAKRKIKCYKENGKYRFLIEIKCNGNLVFNELYPHMKSDYDIKMQAQKDLEEEIEKKCKEVIKKLQKVYKLDAIQLGSFAAAKFGRHSGVDWNEVVSNSDIEVKAKIEILRIGRGEY